MKIIIFYLFFTLDAFFSVRVLPSTPKAKNLLNHYGTNLNKNFYGPERDDGIKRVGNDNNISIQTPLINYEKEIITNSENIKAGKLKNIAFDAEKIINPKIAGILLF